MVSFLPDLQDINRLNPARWFRERVDPEASARDFWLGGRGQADDPRLRLEYGEQARSQLGDIYSRTMGPSEFREQQLELAGQLGQPRDTFAPSIAQLQQAAAGDVEGRAQRGVRRAGAAALANIRAAANTARGFGAGAARRQGMLQAQDLQRALAGQMTEAALSEQEAAQAQLMQALAAQSQEQLAGQQQLANLLAAGRGGDVSAMGVGLDATQAGIGMSAEELRARAAALGMDVGMAERLFGLGGQLAQLGGGG